MDTITKEKRILRYVYVGYLLFNLILLVNHEMWRDEVNVWLIGRELNIKELFREIKYQGHPCLWYLLIMPFAKLGFPVRVMGLISMTFMSVAAGLFLFRAPVNFIVKSISLYTPIFTYYYAQIARGYCLVAFFIILLAVFYEQRNQKPFVYGLLLGLLVQADTIGLPVAGMISIMWLGESIEESVRKKKMLFFLTAAKGLWIPAVSLVGWILQFIHISDSPVYQVASYDMKGLVEASIQYAYWILERLTGWKQPVIIWLYLMILLLSILYSFCVKNIWPIIVMGGTLLFYCVFSCIIYQLNIWHFITLLFVYIWMLWIYAEQKNGLQSDYTIIKRLINLSRYGLEMLFLVIAIFMFIRWNSPLEASNMKNALQGVYSDGETAAQFIAENIDTNEVIIFDNVPYASSVMAFLTDYRAYFAGSKKETTYADWSEEQSQSILFMDMVKWVKEEFPEKESFILIGCNESCIPDRLEGLQEAILLYETKDDTAMGEEYQIYRIKTE